MVRIALISFAMGCMALFATAQPTSFERVFIVDGYQTIANFVMETSDHGFLIVGERAELGSDWNTWVTKLDAAGSVEWDQQYGGAGEEHGQSAVELSDSTFLICGYGQPDGGGDQYGFLLALSQQGTELQQDDYSQAGTNTNFFQTVSDSNGNIYVVGNKRYLPSSVRHGYVAKMDPQGTVVWEDTIPGAASSNGLFDLLLANDDTLLVSGQLPGIGASHFASINTTNGQLNWQQSYAPVRITSIAKKPAGGYYLAGGFEVTGYLLETDATGSLMWDTTYYAGGFVDVNPGQVVVPSDGSTGYVMLSSPQLTTTRYNPSGAPVWAKTGTLIGTPGTQSATFLTACSDGGYASVGWVINGTTSWGVHFMKIGPLGELECSAALAFEEPEICMVGLDSATSKHEVVWEKGVAGPAYSVLDIYRETSVSGEWDLIGTVDSSDFSTFVDTGADPTVAASRYQVVKRHDYCLTNSMASGVHQTMHLTVNAGANNSWNLIWSAYEGFAVTTYNIWRGASASTLQMVGSVNGSSFTWTDATPPAGGLVYQIEVVKAQACNPTAKADDYGSVRSNFADNGLVTTENIVVQKSAFSVFPNPVTNQLSINSSDKNQPIAGLELFNATGLRLSSWTTLGAISFTVSLAEIPAGIYFLTIRTEDGDQTHQRIVKID